VQAIKVPPLMPLIPYLPEAFNISFLPPFYFTYWILAIAIIAIFHEFAHGIYAKSFGVKIKTTGFGFLGPFLAAFVEPDEKQMESKSKLQQITILSAGTFVNLILAVLFFLLLALFFVSAYAPAGAMFNDYMPGIVSVGSVTMIGGISMDNPSRAGLLETIYQNNLTDDLILGSNGNVLNFTKVIANNRTYYITIENLKEQLGEEEDIIGLYEDFPAINAGLKGTIVEVDGEEINEYEDLSEVMQRYGPGDEINIKTKVGEEITEYDITLAESPYEKGRAVIGIGYRGAQRQGIMGKLFDFFNFFREPATLYEPKFNPELVIFIYNLIWWIALINFSVALINMWPVAIFDGGRMFMLTIWGITRSERAGKLAFKITTYLILGVLLLLMWGWFNAFF